MKKVFFAENLEELNKISIKILNLTSSKKFAFFGSMGVGKTTLIKFLSLHLGLVEMVSSPTFSIINEYHISNDEKIYHFDFYRIDNIEEAYDIGYEEYFQSSYYCFIEWPEKILSLIDSDVVSVKMSQVGEKRKIELIF